MEKNKKQHPAFGLLSINKCFGAGGNQLFGSDIENPSYVEIEIRPAEVEVDEITGEERICASSRMPFIRVNMSNLQFADAIFNHNINDGVPCTIIYKDNQLVEKLPKRIESKGERLQTFFKQRMRKMAEQYIQDSERVKELMDKKYLTQDEKKEISNIFEGLQRNLKNNIPYWIDLFQEATEKTILQAKTELDGILTNVIHKKGLEALGIEKLDNPLAIEDTNKKEE